ncbi:MAG: NUDIX hydrolase [Xanthomonadales bacterium]|nr:NUDIX hydrolase [Xanthomonadales bacterium]
MTEPETLCNGRWLRLKRRGRWEYAERTNPGGAVMIIAVTPDDRILFVEQPRPAVERRTIEMPAGLVGDSAARADEGILETANRELVEETGYRAGSLRLLIDGPPSAGMSSEVMGFVLARELVRVGSGGGDATESITVHEIPRGEALGWLLERHRTGHSVDPKVFAGLYMLDNAAFFA